VQYDESKNIFYDDGALFIFPVFFFHAQGGRFLKVGPEAAWEGDEKRLI